MNLSPFTKDFRGQEQLQWVLTDFFSAVDSLLASTVTINIYYGMKRSFQSPNNCIVQISCRKKTVFCMSFHCLLSIFSMILLFCLLFFIPKSCPVVFIGCWMSRKTFFDLITERIKKLQIILKNFKFEITYLRLIYSRLEAIKKYFPPCNG